MGVVHSSNLCTEILLNTSKEETAVCNLGSINLAMHVTKKASTRNSLAATIRTAVRMLDNVIDINFYPTRKLKMPTCNTVRLALGFMGFQDALYIQNISYASHAAVEFADQCMEMISYYAILLRLNSPTNEEPIRLIEGSKWDRGLSSDRYD